jgi:hypothetical protein
MITTEPPQTRTLTVPVVALVVLAAVLVAASVGAARRVADARDEATAARRGAALARGEGGVGDVIVALQGERASAATSLLAPVRPDVAVRRLHDRRRPPHRRACRRGALG